METRRFFDVIYWRWSDRSSPVKQGRRFRLLLTILFLAIALNFEHNGVSGQTPKVNSRDIIDSPKAVACPVSVMGAVYNSGKFELGRSMRLKEVIALTGGLTAGAKGTIRIRHRRMSDTCSVDVFIPDVKEYFIQRIDDDDLSNPVVLRGDEIEVVSLDIVYITGMVRHPQAAFVGSPITVSRAIASAGGMLPQARQDRITIYRRSEATGETRMIPVNLKDVGRGKAIDQVLQPWDIIDIPGRGGRSCVFRFNFTEVFTDLKTMFADPTVRVIY